MVAADALHESVDVRYFRELAEGLAAIQSEEAAMQLRRQLSARYNIEVVGPPVEAR